MGLDVSEHGESQGPLHHLAAPGVATKVWRCCGCGQCCILLPAPCRLHSLQLRDFSRGHRTGGFPSVVPVAIATHVCLLCSALADMGRVVTASGKKSFSLASEQAPGSTFPTSSTTDRAIFESSEQGRWDPAAGPPRGANNDAAVAQQVLLQQPGGLRGGGSWAVGAGRGTATAAEQQPVTMKATPSYSTVPYSLYSGAGLAPLPRDPGVGGEREAAPGTGAIYYNEAVGAQEGCA